MMISIASCFFYKQKERYQSKITAHLERKISSLFAIFLLYYHVFLFKKNEKVESEKIIYTRFLIGGGIISDD